MFGIRYGSFTTARVRHACVTDKPERVDRACRLGHGLGENLPEMLGIIHFINTLLLILIVDINPCRHDGIRPRPR